MVELVEQRSQEIPAQTMINPKEIASDTQLEDESENPKEPEDEKELEMNLLLEDNEASIPMESTSTSKVTFEVSIFFMFLLYFFLVDLQSSRRRNIRKTCWKP